MSVAAFSTTGKLKAVQTGAPSRVYSEKYLDMPVDYESLASVGSAMGSGGFIVMDEDTCMVDMARFFMEPPRRSLVASVSRAVSVRARCWTSSRRFVQARGSPATSRRWRNWGATSRWLLCGLGQGAPNPVLSMIENFREEYEAHIYDKTCPAKVCRALIEYKIDRDLHRLHALRAQLPGECHYRVCTSASRHRSRDLHPLWYLRSGLPGQCRER